MSLNQLFDTIDKARDTAQWQAAFGQPQEIEGRTVIPVARVSYAFGFGFGQGTPPASEEGEATSVGEGGGGGGGASANPMGVIVVEGDEVSFRPIEDESRIALAGIGLGALAVLQFALTLRAIFGRD
ncbi:MAG: GerW family sporulation protein [Anaerolineae bacterium]